VGDANDLVQLNGEIAERETAGDTAWFDQLLAPQFAMRRANFAHMGRAEFLAAVARSALRSTEDVIVAHHTDRTAAVTCTVHMQQADGTWATYRNVRLFTRGSSTHDWHMLAWANEPADG
jgi:hypothetical protein